MRNTASIPATFKPSGGIVAQPAAEPVEPPLAAPTATDDLYAVWQNLTAKEAASTPVAQLLTLLGIRLIEVDPEGLEGDTISSFVGKVGEGIVVVPRTMPQADREPIVRRFLDQIGTEYKVLKERDPNRPLFREARLKIECFDWCTEDHTEPQFADDIIHAGQPAELEVTGENGDRVPLLHSRLGVDPFSPDTVQHNPHVVVDDEQSMYFLPPMQALEFADEMTAFADEVRGQARRAAQRPGDRVPPAAEAGHYPWCNTAACTTHPWGDGTDRTYTEHFGPDFNMPIPEGMDVPHDEMVRMTLGVSEEFGGRPEISFNCGGNGVLLDEDGTDQAIANLEAALSALRAMRAQMVQEKQA
ncbi:hypothetical protein A6E92_22350 [Streptomyces sp. S8]|uniref:DUF6907 domain-containing protein n=1 Tax=Streptomyces sp. S8 TaxID=1837283 RepID=UPI000A095224|nr:hypothetical protein [Streptomyces sp. S8]ARI54606.1 hypothetical protein A6E92_22350 [Streptomyces sp. S8]